MGKRTVFGEDTHKRCPRCFIRKTVSNFLVEKCKSGFRYVSWCRECQARRVGAWKKRNVKRARKQSKKDKKNSYLRRGAFLAKAELLKLRKRVLRGYGGKCVCCGETEHHFLQLDHINNDGYLHRGNGKHRPGRTFYKSLIEAKYPGEHLQILCANCNMGKARCGGICPHKKELLTSELPEDTIQPVV